MGNKFYIANYNLHLAAQQCPANLTHMSVVCPNIVHVNMCIYIHRHAWTNRCVRTYICRDIIDVHVYICRHEHKYVRLSINRFITLSLYIYMYIYIYKYTHTHRCFVCGCVCQRVRARMRAIRKRRNKTKGKGGKYLKKHKENGTIKYAALSISSFSLRGQVRFGGCGSSLHYGIEFGRSRTGEGSSGGRKRGVV
jgi:hypothetical protein